MYNSRLESTNLALFLGSCARWFTVLYIFFQLRPEFTDVVLEMEQLPHMITPKGMEATSIGLLSLLQDFVCCMGNALQDVI